MKHTLVLVTAAAFFPCSQPLYAGVASNLLALTGNCRAKLTWVRFPWCDDNYNPVQAYRSDIDAYNEGTHTQLMSFDTDIDAPRYLDSTVGSHLFPRLTYKDASYVIWTDNVGKASWIRDFAGKTPRRKLIDGGDYAVVDCQLDPSTGGDIIYIESADEKTIYKAPLKSDGTVDITQKQQIYRISTNTTFDRGRISLSLDGKYIGCALGWPNTCLVQVSNGNVLGRHAGEMFGCEPCIAPDNSYRFYHLGTSHDTLRMWDAALSTTMWSVKINEFPLNIPGLYNSFGWTHDCVAPRWTNNVQFLTNSYPFMITHFTASDHFSIFDENAASLIQKQKDSVEAGRFFLCKFSADFKTLEKYVQVSDGDIRHRDVMGDAWISSTPSAVVSHRNPIGSFQTAKTWRTSYGAIIIEAVFPSGVNGSVSLLPSSGRVVSSASGSGRVRCFAGRAASGICFIRIVGGETRQDFRVVLEH